jgi:hypothetical protein
MSIREVVTFWMLSLARLMIGAKVKEEVNLVLIKKTRIQK